MDSAVSRPSSKKWTITNLVRAKAYLIGFFGLAREIGSISAGDADKLWNWLIGPRKLALNTARRACGRAKQAFKTAMRSKIIPENPFADLKCAVMPNSKRLVFVSRAEIDQVFAACPNASWWLLVALARYGGLQIPSEIVGMT